MAGAHWNDPSTLEGQKKKIQEAAIIFLDAAGIVVEGAAKLLCPVDTGNLRNSITYRVTGNRCKVGTNVHYGPHQEFGTCKMKAQPYLRPALQNNEDKLRKLAKDIVWKQITS